MFKTKKTSSFTKFGLTIIIFFLTLVVYKRIEFQPIYTKSVSIINKKVVFEDPKVEKQWRHSPPKRLVWFSEQDLTNDLKTANKHIALQSSKKVFPKEKNLPEMRKKSGYTYIKIPSLTYNLSHDNDRFASQYTKKLNYYIDTACNSKLPIILDFRGNIGGFQEPMILGVSQLLPNDNIYSYKDKHGQIFNATLKSTRNAVRLSSPLHTLNRQLAHPNLKYRKKYQNKKIFIIMDSNTCSAAEITIVSLVNNNKNIKIAGTKSGGYTTLNTQEKLSHSSYALTYPIAYLQFIGRKNNQDTKLKPDIKFTNYNNLVTN